MYENLDQRYGEKPAANPDYVNYLNHHQKNSPYRDGNSFTHWLNGLVTSPTEKVCGGEEVDVGPDLTETMTDEQREFLLKEVGDPPPSGGPVRTQLPDVNVGTPDVYKFGYYRYKDGDKKVYGTERTIWRLKAAGKLLAEENIVMGVGDISSRGGPTGGHREHQGGQDVDLRLINDQGVAGPCTVSRSCYNREKTFKMIKTLIDVDPTKVDKVLINDPELRSKINSYYKEKTGSSRNISRSCAGHDNHIHFSWKS